VVVKRCLGNTGLRDDLVDACGMITLAIEEVKGGGQDAFMDSGGWRGGRAHGFGGYGRQTCRSRVSLRKFHGFCKCTISSHFQSPAAIAATLLVILSGVQSHHRLRSRRPMVSSLNRWRINRAGLPPTMALGSTSRVTTEHAPMTAPSPMRTPGRMTL